MATASCYRPFHTIEIVRENVLIDEFGWPSDSVLLFKRCLYWADIPKYHQAGFFEKNIGHSTQNSKIKGFAKELGWTRKRVERALAFFAHYYDSVESYNKALETNEDPGQGKLFISVYDNWKKTAKHYINRPRVNDLMMRVEEKISQELNNDLVSENNPPRAKSIMGEIPQERNRSWEKSPKSEIDQLQERNRSAPSAKRTLSKSEIDHGYKEYNNNINKTNTKLSDIPPVDNSVVIPLVQFSSDEKEILEGYNTSFGQDKVLTVKNVRKLRELRTFLASKPDWGGEWGVEKFKLYHEGLSKDDIYGGEVILPEKGEYFEMQPTTCWDIDNFEKFYKASGMKEIVMVIEKKVSNIDDLPESDLAKHFREVCLKVVGAPRYISWFEKLEITEEPDGSLTLKAPNVYHFNELLKQHHEDNLKAILAKPHLRVAKLKIFVIDNYTGKPKEKIITDRVKIAKNFGKAMRNPDSENKNAFA